MNDPTMVTGTAPGVQLPGRGTVRAWATVASVAIAVAALVRVVGVLYTGWGLYSIRAAASGRPLSDEELDAGGSILLLGVLTFVALLLAGAGFVVWLYLARTLATTSGRGLRWGRGWTIGAWFVPVANLVLPALVVADLWRAVVRRVPVPVATWWLCCLAAIVADQSAGAARVARGVAPADQLDALYTVAVLHTVESVLDLTAAALAVLILVRITGPVAGPGPADPYPPTPAAGASGPPVASPHAAGRPSQAGLSRRSVLLGGAATLAVAGGLGGALWAMLGGGHELRERWRLTERPHIKIIPAGDVVVVRNDRLLRGLDPVTGAQRWSYPMTDQIGTVLSGPDGLYVEEQTALACVDVASGERRWRLPSSYPAAAAGPTAVAFRVVLSGGAEIVGVSSADGSTVWRLPVSETPTTATAAPDGLAHVVVGTEVLTVDTASGNVLWRRPAPSTAELQRCGRVLVVSDGARLLLLDATVGTELPAPPTGGYPMPAVVGSTLVVADDAGTTGWDTVADRVAWTVPRNTDDDSDIMTTFLVAGPDLVLALGQTEPVTGDLQVRALAEQDGAELWTASVPGVGDVESGGFFDRAGPVVVGDTLVLADEAGTVLGLGPVS